MATVIDGVTIKKEIEDPDSPDGQDSGQGQAENQSGQKLSKVWGDDETRSLIELAKVYIPKFKDSTYTKKELLDDISREMRAMGYDVTPNNARNKLKYLRARYRSVLHYNAKHVEKRVMPFHEALHELYSLDYFDDNDLNGSIEQNGNGSNDTAFTPVTSKRNKSKTIPASHVDLRTVVTSKKKPQAAQVVHKGTKFAIKRKGGTKSRVQPMFQCGLCMEKFKTSHDMHDHSCKNVTKGSNDVKKKVNAASSTASNGVFHWNSLITMQFLELLKDYQDSHKNSNFRKGNIWENMSTLMKRRGHVIHPKEIEKKWKVLTTAFDKTLQYNKAHKDKKKCAFFKRLTDLYRHPSSFNCFKGEETVKMTVEVSPFSFAASRDSRPSVNSAPQRKNSVQENHKSPPVGQGGSMPELMMWLDNTWNEWKELEKKREAMHAQRHHELLEMLSYLVEGRGDMDT